MIEQLNIIFNDPLYGRLLKLAIGIVIILFLIGILRRTVVKYVSDNESKYRIRKSFNFFGYLLIIIVALYSFSDSLSGLTVALGVAGAGIAFALQEVIASIAGWLAIMFGGFYKTGDRVQLGGIKGDVIDIGILRTTLMELGQWVDGDIYNGRIVRVANSFVFKEPVFNYSADFPFLWDEIKIPVQYGSNYDLARSIIIKAAEDIVSQYSNIARESWKIIVKKYLIEDASTDPMITMVTNDNWVEYTLRYVVDFKKRRLTKDLLFSRILKDIEETSGKVGFASTTIQIVDSPFKIKDVKK